MFRPTLMPCLFLTALVVLLAGCGSTFIPPSLTLEVTPGALNIPARGQATAQIVVRRVGAPGAVTLSSPDLPDALVVTLDTTAPQEQAVATVTVKPGTPAGLYQWHLKASAALASGEVTVPVEVLAEPDTMPPQVSLRADRAAITSASTVTLSADASDDVGVASVSLYRAGTAVATLTETPWTFRVNLTTSDNGRQEFTVKATDTAGNTAWSPAVALEVHIDQAAPTVTVNSDTATTQAAYHLTGLVQGDSMVQTVTVALGHAAPHPASHSGVTFQDDLTLAAGENTILVTATDATGLVGSITHRVTYTPPDVVPPTIRLTSSAAGILTTSAPVTLTAAATDNRAIRDVTFVVDGGSYEPLATVSAAPYTATFRPFSVLNGVHTITATATDTSGLTATARLTLTVDIERVGPVITITSPGIIEDGSHHVLTGTVSDPSGVAGLRLQPAGGGADIPGLRLQNGTFSVPLPVPVGYWRYVLTAEDGMGNITRVDVAVNNRGPDVTAPVQQPVWVPDETVSYSNPFAVVTRAQDDRGLARVELFVDGRLTATRTVQPYVPPCTPPVNGVQECSNPDALTPPEVRTVFTTAFAAAQNGQHTLQVRATDAAGNTSTGPLLTLTVAIDPAHPARLQATSVGGRMFGWPGGTVGVSTVREQTGDPAGGPLHTLAETTVGPDDRFSFPLPTSAEITPFLKVVSSPASAGCTSALTVSDPVARSSSPLLFSPGPGISSAEVRLVGHSPDGLERRGLWVYADRAVTIQGLIRCVSTSGFVDTDRYALALSAGWTLVAMDSVPTADPRVSREIRYSNGSLDGLYWAYD